MGKSFDLQSRQNVHSYYDIQIINITDYIILIR